MWEIEKSTFGTRSAFGEMPSQAEIIPPFFSGLADAKGRENS